MFRAIQFVLVAVVLFGTCAVAQAESIPLLKNVTTGVVMFQDGFESGTVGSVPGQYNPTVGEWVDIVQPASGGHVWVTDEATTGVAAYEGSQYLDVYRYSNAAVLHGAAGAASGASDMVMFQAAFYGGVYEGVYVDEYNKLAFFSDSAELSGFITLPSGAFAYRNAGNSAWVSLTQTWTAGQWNTLVITHTNSTADWTVSINGQTAETVTSFAAGETNVVSKLQFVAASAYGNGGYWDAIPIPEPSSLALLAMGLIGLLCYAWRKRK